MFGYKMLQGIDEQELARRCATKDRQAETELYMHYAAKLFTFCRRYANSRDEALDLMQDTFLKAFEKMSTFQYTGKGSFYAWITRIAMNKALDHAKKNKFHFLSLDIFQTGMEPEPIEEELRQLPEEKLLDFIAELPEVQRMVFNMFCIDGFSHKEIAERLAITEKGSASMLAKAKAKVKKRINDYLKDTE